ncbi:MAG: tryptophan-rich sensory protein [Candidatus Moranbacteria bacterium]|jgi:tryptophan-rich sensory protein|nr:tryptophan-rich sensory protein [Candidatus Moranbacteria bacterium]
MNKIKMNKIKLSISIVIPLFAGFLGSIFTNTSVATWYQTLSVPPLNPPSWVFAPVWTVLYIMMGIAFYLVWRKKETGRDIFWSVWIFFVQLFFNILWSLLFFGMENPMLALWGVGMLWITIFLNVIAFARVEKKSAWLMLPYLVWVSFAAYLNYAIFILNS